MRPGAHGAKRIEKTCHELHAPANGPQPPVSPMKTPADPYAILSISTHTIPRRPFIELLSPSREGVYLDVGCGTGNYLAALQSRGLSIWGIDPSSTMLTAAKTQWPDTVLCQTPVEYLPFPDESFVGAIAILTTHHWKDLVQGLTEVRRVLAQGGCLILFTFTPEQIRGYWLREYFPAMIGKAEATGVPLSELERALHVAGFDTITSEPYHIRDDLRDHFLYSNKHRPDAYLHPEVRAGSSAFQVLADTTEVADGVTRLHDDISTGRIHQIIQDASRASDAIGDYLFVRAAL